MTGPWTAERSDRTGPPALADALALSALFLALTYWSWGKWPDPYVDFGRELYVAWQLSVGKALYRDIADRSGPLSPWINATWFAWFGPSVRTLAACNLVLLAATTALLHRLCALACDRLTAFVAAGMFLGVFAFSQYVGVGNYNYVTPYSHHQTHGVLLALGMVLAWHAWLRQGGLWRAALSGVCLGLLSLTKLELMAPATAAAGACWLLSAFSGFVAGRERRRAAAVFVASSLAPAAAALACLATQMPLATALRGLCGNACSIAGAAPLGDRFYLSGMGLVAPGHNLARMAEVTAAFAAALAGAALLGRLLGRLRAPSAPWLVGLFMAALLSARLPWTGFGRALLPATAVGLAIVAWRLRQEAFEREKFERLGLAAVWGVFSLGLLSKIFLIPRVHHYGFVLAMPAAVFAVMLALHLLPALVEPLGRETVVYRAAVAGMVATGVVFHLKGSNGYYSAKQYRIGKGGDAVVTFRPEQDPRGPIFARALAEIGRVVPPGATLAALPDACMLNYLLRLDNPSRYLLLNPSEFGSAGGEAAVLEDLRRASPDFIALVSSQMDEFGVGRFGADPRFGAGILAWVRSAYEPVLEFGDDPVSGAGYGISLLRRRERAAGGSLLDERRSRPASPRR